MMSVSRLGRARKSKGVAVKRRDEQEKTLAHALSNGTPHAYSAETPSTDNGWR